MGTKEMVHFMCPLRKPLGGRRIDSREISCVCGEKMECPNGVGIQEIDGRTGIQCNVIM